MGSEFCEWRDCKLGDVLELKRGYDLPSQQRQPGSVPIVSSSGPSGFHAEAKVKAPGVVTGRYGTIGEVFFVTQDFWPLNTTLYVRDFKGSDPKFVSYFLKAIDFYSCSDKAAVPGVNRNHLHELPVRVPPLNTQRAIARILGALDDKIELNRKMNETLEAMARALFKSWFVDFDPVREKSQGRAPSGMDAETAKLFPHEFVESELGMIPKGWRVTTLSEAAELNPPRMLRKGTLAPYVEMSNLPTRGHRPMEWPLREMGSGAKFQNGDTLLARITPCLENGKTGFVDFLADGEIGWGSTEYIVIAPRVPLPAEWGYLLARDEAFRDFAKQKMEGSTGRQRVPADALSQYLVAIPTDSVAQYFGQLVQLWFQRMAEAHAESTTLARLRDSLLPRLLSGELSVAVAEKELGAV